MEENGNIRVDHGNDSIVSWATWCLRVWGATVCFTDPDPTQMFQMLPRERWALTWTLAGPESTKISSQSLLPWNKGFINPSYPHSSGPAVIFTCNLWFYFFLQGIKATFEEKNNRLTVCFTNNGSASWVTLARLDGVHRPLVWATFDFRKGLFVLLENHKCKSKIQRKTCLFAEIPAVVCIAD